jgi:hypothetical protein
MHRCHATGFLLLATLAGCRVEGNGVYAERSIQLEPFQAVQISLGIKATVNVASGPQVVVLSGDENVLEHINITWSGVAPGGTLGTSTDLSGTFTTVHPLRLLIFTPALTAVMAQEAAQVAVTGAATPTFTVAASGQSQVTLAGPGGAELVAAVLSSSSLLAFGYPVEGALVTVDDHSSAQLACAGDVLGTVTHWSAVEVHGGGTCSATTDPHSTCGP